MTPFTTLTAVAAPLPIPNVDTDQVIPARFLSKPREEMRGGMFHDLRYDEAGSPRRGFPLNEAGYKGAEILVAERNFACGSSREMAVWAMLDNGFRAFIAPSFGDIFFNNCFQNGCLPIVLPAERVRELLAFLAELPGAKLSIDLAAQTVTGPDGKADRFEIDAFRKQCLLQGLDDVGITLQHDREIAAFEGQQKAEMGWL